MKTDWVQLESESQLEGLINDSFTRPVVLFKHSNRCSLSSLALNRLQNLQQFSGNADFYFLDLLRYRNISNAVADQLQVYHQSPQLLLVKDGECIYEASHLDIHASELSEQLAEVA